MARKNGELCASDQQARRVDLLARIDELDRMSKVTTDHETLEWVAERKKVLLAALTSP